MKVYIARYSGFCDGTRRALKKAENAIAGSEVGRVVAIGSLVHNPLVNESLAERGVRILRGVDEVPKGATVILRAHGTTLEDLKTLNDKGVDIYDCVCRNVDVIYKKIQEYRDSGFRIILAGDRSHAETIGHLSRGGSDMISITSLEEALSVPAYGGAAVLIAQTSFDSGEYSEIGNILKRIFRDLIIENTLCGWMQKAQAEAVTLAGRVCAMVVIGGYESANTKRLTERCIETGTKTFHVETHSELDEDDFNDIDSVGIAAGASTPTESIESVTDWFHDCFGADIIANDMN